MNFVNFPSRHSQITKPKFFQVTSDIKNLSSYSKTCICNRALRTPQEKASRNILFYLLNIATNIDWHYSFKQTKLNKGKTRCLRTAGLKASFFSIILQLKSNLPTAFLILPTDVRTSSLHCKNYWVLKNQMF